MRRLIELLKTYNYVVVFLLLIAISIVLVMQQTYYQQSRIINWGNSVAGVIYNTTSSVTRYFGLVGENEALAEENARLRQQIAESYTSYSNEIFTERDTTYKLSYTYITAEVIKASWDKPANYIMINKGTTHGIAKGMGVASPQGIVGTVVDVSPNFATVMTVLHPQSSKSVKMTRSGANGTLIWEGINYRYAVVNDIPTTHKFERGDTIITSGQDPTFPKGIMVGYVEEAIPIAGSGFYKINLQLSTEFNRLQNVYIISNRFAQEQKELTDNIQ